MAPRSRSARALAHDRIERIGAQRNRGDSQSCGRIGGQIFKAVDGQIDVPGEQRFFNFLGKQAFTARLHQRCRLQMVAGGFDDFDAGLDTGFEELSGNVMRLPERQLRSARTDSEHRNGSAIAQAEHASYHVDQFSIAAGLVGAGGRRPPGYAFPKSDHARSC